MAVTLISQLLVCVCTWDGLALIYADGQGFVNAGYVRTYPYSETKSFIDTSPEVLSG